MQYWADGLIVDILQLCALLLLAQVLHRKLPLLAKLAIPPALAAGAVGLLLGSQGLGWMPMDTSLLEKVVYHALPLVYLAHGLRRSHVEKGSMDARGVAFGVAVVTIVQGVIGLLVVLAWSQSAGLLHPGYGLLLPLSFSQGPGQALSIGSSWEAGGLAHGGQLGLLYCVFAYVWCVAGGVPLVLLARRRGWIDALPTAPAEQRAALLPEAGLSEGIDRLSVQIGLVAVCYLVVYGVVAGLAALLAGKPGVASIIWGFPFIVSMGVAALVNTLVNRLDAWSEVDDRALAGLAGFVVDVAAVAALSALRLDVVVNFALPVLLVTTVGGLITLWTTLWLSARAFGPNAFRYFLALWGNLAGTLPMAFALLRLVDPDFRTPVARQMLVGLAGTAALCLPVLFGGIIVPVIGWPGNYPGGLVVTAVGIGLYALLLMVAWSRWGGFRWTRPLLSPWPSRSEDQGGP